MKWCLQKKQLFLLIKVEKWIFVLLFPYYYCLLLKLLLKLVLEFLISQVNFRPLALSCYFIFLTGDLSLKANRTDWVRWRDGCTAASLQEPKLKLCSNTKQLPSAMDLNKMVTVDFHLLPVSPPSPRLHSFSYPIFSVPLCITIPIIFKGNKKK